MGERQFGGKEHFGVCEGIKRTLRIKLVHLTRGEETQRSARQCQRRVPLCGEKWNCHQRRKVTGKCKHKHFQALSAFKTCRISVRIGTCWRCVCVYVCLFVFCFVFLVFFWSESADRWQRSCRSERSGLNTSARTASRCCNKTKRQSARWFQNLGTMLRLASELKF